MKILVRLHSVPPQRWVGGELMTLKLAELLRERGHQVDIYRHMGGLEDIVYKNFTVKSAAFLHSRLISMYDVVITHPEIRHAITHEAAQHRIPYVAIVHNLNLPTVRSLQRLPPHLTVANSYYTASHLPAGLRKTVVVYPSLEKRSSGVTNPCNAIQVNVSADKGAAIFERVAEAMPDHPFVAVLGGHGVQIPPNLPNVTVQPATGDMDTLYDHARVMLAPSLTETWGMAVGEAIMRGIPVVATPLPAFKECAGDAPIYAETAAEWISSVSRLLTDGAHYDERRHAALVQQAILEVRMQEMSALWIDSIEALA